MRLPGKSAAGPGQRRDGSRPSSEGANWGAWGSSARGLCSHPLARGPARLAQRGAGPRGPDPVCRGPDPGCGLSGVAGSGGLGALRSGGLEASNVDLAREMVNQTLSQRGAEANVKSIQTANEMLGTVLDMVE